MSTPRIRTTTVGSYPIPDWLVALPSEPARLDATRVILVTQRQAVRDWESFPPHSPMSFRRKPAGVVEGDLAEGSLNLKADCALAASVAQGAFKFTVTSPYMLARSVLDNHYHNFETLTMAIASVLASQVAGLPC